MPAQLWLARERAAARSERRLDNGVRRPARLAACSSRAPLLLHQGRSCEVPRPRKRPLLRKQASVQYDQGAAPSVGEGDGKHAALRRTSPRSRAARAAVVVRSSGVRQLAQLEIVNVNSR